MSVRSNNRRQRRQHPVNPDSCYTFAESCAVEPSISRCRTVYQLRREIGFPIIFQMSSPRSDGSMDQRTYRWSLQYSGAIADEGQTATRKSGTLPIEAREKATCPYCEVCSLQSAIDNPRTRVWKVLWLCRLRVAPLRHTSAELVRAKPYPPAWSAHRPSPLCGSAQVLRSALRR